MAKIERRTRRYPRRLGMPDRSTEREEMAVGLEHSGESYGLLVDAVGEVMQLSSDTHEPAPVHMDPRWVKLSNGVHRLDDRLLIVLDADAVFIFEQDNHAV